jgi:hypothetical protein
MRLEIEAKRQDLRMMVGERYRDLIDAADSIAEMKNAAQNITETLQKMQIALSSQKHIAKKVDDNTAWLYPVTSQIKLLIDTPEQIYHALERCQFHRAAQIYKLAYMINQTLNNLQVSARFPVAQKQWDAVYPLKEQILQRAMTHQRLTHHSAASQADACKARSLLEKMDAVKSFNKFLDTRTQLLTDLVEQAQDGSVNAPSLMEIVNILYTTMRQSQGVIAGINQPDDVQSVSQLFPAKANVLLHHLPAESATWIQDDQRGQISSSVQKQVLGQWIKQSQTRLGAGLTSVLNQVALARPLWDLRGNVMNGMELEETEKESKPSWNAVCEMLISEEVHVSGIVEEAFRKRAKVIIEQQFQGVHEQPRLVLEQELKGLEAASPFQSVRDVAWLLWHTTDSETVNEFALDTLVCHVLSQISASLQGVSEDLECLHEVLSKDLEHASLNALEQFAVNLRSMYSSITFGKDAKDEWIAIDQALAIGRVARAVTVKMDSLVLFQQVKLGKRDKNVPLQHVQEFHKVAQQCHEAWIEHVSRIIGKRLDEALKSINWSDPRALREAWEAVAIKGTDESGTSMEDKQYLPVQVTPALMQVVFLICKELNRAFAHTMDRVTLQALRKALERDIYHAWTNFQASVEPSETGAMQLLFDYSFFQKLVPSKGKSAQWLKSLMDPIELKLAETGLMANVDRFYLRTSVLLGSLTLVNPNPLEGKKNPTLQELHNTLALAPQAPRFSLLPVVGTMKKPIRDISLTSMPSRTQKSSLRPRLTNGQLKLTEGTSVSTVEKETTDYGSLQGISQRLETIGGGVTSGVSSLLGFLANPVPQSARGQNGTSPSPRTSTDIPFFM